MIDETLYRVTLICSCNNDIAFGYGATVDVARTAAIEFFRKDHGRRARWREEIVEKAVENAHSNGSHYEECSP